MKPIAFKESAAQKVYTDYMNRIRRMTKTLTANDREEVLMEFNSHIYESLQRHAQSETAEVDNLLLVLEKLGTPEDVLRPVVAELKLNQATKTFNPLHVFKALVLNIGNGIFYVFMSILYLFLFAFVFVIGAKIINPDKVGLYFKDGSLQALGSIDDATIKSQGIQEVLGDWFIPVMIVVTVLFYFLITLILRIKRKKK